MNRWVAFGLGLSLLLGGGVVHGLYADRWQTSSALDDACARIALTPHAIAGWIGEDQATDEKEYAQAGAQQYWNRVYRKNGSEFLVILMAGRAGRMSVHTPDVCYRGAGFEMFGSASQLTVRDASHTELGSFWSATFVKPGAIKTELQLTWAWSDGQLWSAPTNPRWTFAGQPSLYKLYVSQNVTGLASDVAESNRNDFLRVFLSELNRTLFGHPADREPMSHGPSTGIPASSMALARHRPDE